MARLRQVLGVRPDAHPTLESLGGRLARALDALIHVALVPVLMVLFAYKGLYRPDGLLWLLAAQVMSIAVVALDALLRSGGR